MTCLVLIYVRIVVYMKTVNLNCVKCGSKWVVNRTYKLCKACNKERLHGSGGVLMRKKKNTRGYPTKNKSSLNRLKMGEKRRVVLSKDKETYLQVFNSKNHSCEECGTPLMDIFEVDGKIVDIFQYSHILSKGAFPEFRNDPRNFNRFCFEHHQQWEFGSRDQMEIFEKNQEIINTLFNERSH